MIVKKENLSGTMLVVAVVILNIFAYLVASLVLNSPWRDWLYSAIIQFAMLFCVVLISKFSHFDLKNRGGYTARLDFLSICICALITLCLFVMGLGTSSIVSNLFALLGYENTAVMPDVSTPLNVFLTIFVFCVLPALSEESLMRATVLSGLKKSYSAKKAVFFSALGFALLHGSVTQSVHQFAIGVACALIFLSGKSVWYGVIVHFLNNLVAIVLYIVQNAQSNIVLTQGLDPVKFFSGEVFISLAFAVVGAVGVVFSLILFIKRREKIANISCVSGERFFSRVERLCDDKDCGDFLENKKQNVFFWTAIGIMAFFVAYNFVVTVGMA